MSFLCKAQSHFLEADVSRLKQRGTYLYMLKQPDSSRVSLVVCDSSYSSCALYKIKSTQVQVNDFLGRRAVTSGKTDLDAEVARIKEEASPQQIAACF